MLEIKKTKVLFMCAANVARSVTGEDLLRPLEGYEAKSCGMFQGAKQEVTQELLDWADVIIVMEKYMKDYIQQYTNADKIKVLNIPDRYAYGEKTLINVMTERLLAHGIDATHVKDEWKPSRSWYREETIFDVFDDDIDWEKWR